MVNKLVKNESVLPNLLLLTLCCPADTSVVEQSLLTSMGLAALAEVALSQPVMKL